MIKEAGADWFGMDQRREPAKWCRTRNYKFRRCKLTNKLILPGKMAWVKCYYHYYNGRKAFSAWMCDEAYTFESLKAGAPFANDL